MELIYHVCLSLLKLLNKRITRVEFIEEPTFASASDFWNRNDYISELLSHMLKKIVPTHVVINTFVVETLRLLEFIDYQTIIFSHYFIPLTICSIVYHAAQTDVCLMHLPKFVFLVLVETHLNS